MKKASILILGLVTFIFCMHACRNDLAVWFNTDSFYKPIYSSDFNVLQTGYVVRAELKPSYDIRHGFFLAFKHESCNFQEYNDMSGAIHYTIYTDTVKLESKTISIPNQPMWGLRSDGTCDIALFTFDLPYQGHDKITLEVTVESPIIELAPYRDIIKCEVYPAYWP
jgi:hypothetical protein